jgi:hypothetical protein
LSDPVIAITAEEITTSESETSPFAFSLSGEEIETTEQGASVESEVTFGGESATFGGEEVEW